MKIRYDAEACTGHGRCYALAPEVFDADDQGHCTITGADGTFESVTVPVELERHARLAADNCPEVALTIEE